jgi:hypothetical protein
VSSLVNRLVGCPVALGRIRFSFEPFATTSLKSSARTASKPAIRETPAALILGARHGTHSLNVLRIGSSGSNAPEWAIWRV